MKLTLPEFTEGDTAVNHVLLILTISPSSLFAIEGRSLLPLPLLPFFQYDVG